MENDQLKGKFRKMDIILKERRKYKSSSNNGKS